MVPISRYPESNPILLSALDSPNNLGSRLEHLSHQSTTHSQPTASSPLFPQFTTLPSHLSSYPPTKDQHQSDFVSLRSAASTRFSCLLKQYILTLQPHSKPDFFTFSGGLLPFVFPFWSLPHPLLIQGPPGPCPYNHVSP